MGYFGQAYKGAKNNGLWKAYKAGRERRRLGFDRYGNFEPVPIADGEYWFNGCFIQDQRGMSCQGLPAFCIFPDSPDKSPFETRGGNVATAGTLKAAKAIALDWGMTFKSAHTAKNYL